MRLTGDTEVEAAAEDVWALLVDPTRAASLVPGVEEVRQVGPSTFTGVVVATVGPMCGRFAFQAAIAEEAPPDSLVAEIVGTDNVSKSTVRTTLAFRLETPAPGRTRLRYEATVLVEGRLAIVGDMILRATAGAMFAQFARRLRDEFARQRSAGPRSGGGA